MHDDNWISDKEVESTVTGRFPANLIHDGSDEVVELFPSPHSAGNKKKSNITAGKSIFGIGGIGARNPDTYADSGSASRFFYCAKASKSERNRGCDDLEEKISPKAGSGLLNENGKEKFSDSKIKNNHPTVKPIKLMEYLVKLVTKENTVVLDPFA
jgi:site-specific DNA-methyltransferase (adenine-specific)